jgi:hypothetical protein
MAETSMVVDTESKKKNCAVGPGDHALVRWPAWSAGGLEGGTNASWGSAPARPTSAVIKPLAELQKNLNALAVPRPKTAGMSWCVAGLRCNGGLLDLTADGGGREERQMKPDKPPRQINMQRLERMSVPLHPRDKFSTAMVRRGATPVRPNDARDFRCRSCGLRPRG